MGHALMENRHGLVVGGADSLATARPSARRRPHIANGRHVRVTGKPRNTSVDRRVTRHPGYAVSQRCRKQIEEVFGWIKASAGQAKVKL